MMPSTTHAAVAPTVIPAKAGIHAALTEPEYSSPFSGNVRAEPIVKASPHRLTGACRPLDQLALV